MPQELCGAEKANPPISLPEFLDVTLVGKEMLADVSGKSKVQLFWPIHSGSKL